MRVLLISILFFSFFGAMGQYSSLEEAKEHAESGNITIYEATTGSTGKAIFRTTFNKDIGYNWYYDKDSARFICETFTSDYPYPITDTTVVSDNNSRATFRKVNHSNTPLPLGYKTAYYTADGLRVGYVTTETFEQELLRVLDQYSTECYNDTILWGGNVYFGRPYSEHSFYFIDDWCYRRTNPTFIGFIKWLKQRQDER